MHIQKSAVQRIESQSTKGVTTVISHLDFLFYFLFIFYFLDFFFLT